LQLKKTTIGLSLLATLALLFGGWFLYQKLQVEEPLRTEIGQLQSATLSEMQIGRDEIEIDVNVTKPELFPQEYQNLMRDMTKLAGDKPVEIRVTNQSEMINQIWQSGQFVFEEAIDLHQYSRIPQMIEEWKVTHQLDEALALMDDTNIYVYMKKGTEDFYAIVPRSEDKEVTSHA
jgi:hypothetical protein